MNVSQYRFWPAPLLLLLAFAAFNLLSPAPAAADTLNDLRERFEARYPDLVRAKRDRIIGETWQGTVAVVPDAEADEEVRRLVREENQDRQRLYRIIAEREETTPDLVARRSAQRNFRRAETGEYLRDGENEWFQKPEDYEVPDDEEQNDD